MELVQEHQVYDLKERKKILNILTKTRETLIKFASHNFSQARTLVQNIMKLRGTLQKEIHYKIILLRNQSLPVVPLGNRALPKPM